MLPKMATGHFMGHNALSLTNGYSAISTSGNGTQFFYNYDLHSMDPCLGHPLM